MGVKCVFTVGLLTDENLDSFGHNSDVTVDKLTFILDERFKLDLINAQMARGYRLSAISTCKLFINKQHLFSLRGHINLC